ncbi:MAG: ABC transporter ATP-binding protein [Alphaproteobacteria bacterium]|nr:ABC transporter ATP-binding protein [Alphaproteobacteria bacterium]
MIIIRDISHTYPGTRKQPVRTAIASLSFQVGRGEFCILSGPNGSGKSTLFRILCGLTIPSTGSVTIGGLDLARESHAVRRILGVVFQNPAVDKHLSVGENLAIHADLYGHRGADLAQRLEEALSWSELKHRMGDRVDTLSGGLARQLELAKSLLTRPKVLLLDEPTTGLDPASRRNFLEVLRRVQRERNMTVLMTTHIFSEAEDADHVAIMKGGHLLAFDTPQRLRARVGNEVVVIVPTDAVSLAGRLVTDLNLAPLRFGDELRLDVAAAADSLPLLETVLARYRPEIRSIAIKQPALEDVFIQITSAAHAAGVQESHRIPPASEKEIVQ